MKQAKVIKILDEYTLVINKGSEDTVKIGDVCLVYQLDNEELIDPDTKENLGVLEIVKGFGKVIHVQEKISTIESNEFERKKIVQKPIMNIQKWAGERESFESERIPFKNASINDLVKKVR